MYRRFLRRCGRIPLFRLGVVLVGLSAVVDGLDALGGIDIESLIPAHHDAARVMAQIGLAKIVLRAVLAIATAFAAKGDAE